MDESREGIRAWRLMDELVLDVFAMTRKFPPGTFEDLTSLLRGAAMRGALRIVQGLHRNPSHLPASLRGALGVLEELRYHLYLSRRIGLIDLKQYRAACARHERAARCVREWLRHGPQGLGPGPENLGRGPKGLGPDLQDLGPGPEADTASRAATDSRREGTFSDLESTFAALERAPLGTGEG